MTSQEVIERFCLLQAKVQTKLGWHNSADCFCGKGGFWNCPGYDGTHEGGYRNDGEALEFIEKAVEEKLKQLES